MQHIVEYTNKTAFLVVIKQSNGCTIEINPQGNVKSDNGTHFTNIKYPGMSSKWHRLNVAKIRMY